MQVKLSLKKDSSAVSYNIGYMSEYWYRGVYQAESSVSFGADMEMGSMYIGTWWADVDKVSNTTFTLWITTSN